MLRKLGGKHDLHTCRRRGQKKSEKEEERVSQGRLNGIHVLSHLWRAMGCLHLLFFYLKC